VVNEDGSWPDTIVCQDSILSHGVAPMAISMCVGRKETAFWNRSVVSREGLAISMDYIYEPEIRGLKGYKWANAVEDEYSKLESKAAKIRDKFLSGIPPSALDAHERKTWAMFVATLEHRSPRKVRTSLPLSPNKLFVAGATDFGKWTPDLVAMISMAVNLQIISQRPNFIDSRKRHLTA
jgi:hypothetical protein